MDHGCEGLQQRGGLFMILLNHSLQEELIKFAGGTSREELAMEEGRGVKLKVLQRPLQKSIVVLFHATWSLPDFQREAGSWSHGG